VLSIVELGAAAALVPEASAGWGALAALGLLGTFSIAVGVALARGRRPSCHCFGRLHSAPAGWPTLLRNTGLAALAGTVVWLDPSASARTAGERLVVLGLASAAVVVAVQTWLWFQLLRQNGRILARLDEVERGGPKAPHADALIDSPAPAFDVPAADGGRLSLAGLLARGRPVLLVFGHSGCGPCRELLPRLALWQQERAREFTVALVNEGAPKTASAVRDVGLQIVREVAVTATPAALLIDQDGRIASTLALGADAIAAILPASPLVSLPAARCSRPLPRPQPRPHNHNTSRPSRSTTRSCST
jgi:thiol-disulfide isomerase/thioredoxin